ncbi:DUF928 domain-containing protein [Calothrix membranacea FACHB-236]|nr:DUF928 domain-containing protein [Calothrix membranacea FACHB-236]
MRLFLLRLVSMAALTVTVINSSPALGEKSAAINFNPPPPPPPDRGAPGNRGEGASRGGCTALGLPLTAFVPNYQQSLSQNQTPTITQVWGLTSVEKPSFWFYVPYHQSSLRAIEFVLQTDQNKTIYRTNISLPSVPGIVRVKLQNTPAILENNKSYHWFFKVKVACNHQEFAKLEYVEGWVQRVNLDVALRDRLKQSSPQQQVAIYAENGLWYDALTRLAELRLANPQNAELTEDWKSLLKAIELENLATQPFVY